MSLVREDGVAEWYETSFGRLYRHIYAHRDDKSAAEESAGIVTLLEPAGRRTEILDVCCGNGRHAAALTGMGLDVWGVDLSSTLLAEARAREELAGRVIRADIRELPFGTRFDAVLNLFTSFGYFNEEENEDALAEMARVLVPGGQMLLDHMNRPAVERRVGSDEKKHAEAVIRQNRRIEGNRVLKDIIVIEKGREPVHLTEDVRLYGPDEMTAMLEEAGFEDVRLYGSFAGEPLSEESERMIAVARKREED